MGVDNDKKHDRDDIRITTANKDLVLVVESNLHPDAPIIKISVSELYYLSLNLLKFYCQAQFQP